MSNIRISILDKSEEIGSLIDLVEKYHQGEVSKEDVLSPIRSKYDVGSLPAEKVYQLQAYGEDEIDIKRRL